SLVGLPRYLSLHPGGVVIVPDALSNYVPVQTAAKELDTADGAVPVPAIQFEKDGTEDAGLVKIDLLGNRSLAVIRDAIAAAKEHEGVAIDYTAHDPEADPATKTVFRTGNTMGVFYTESPASRLLCQKSKADTFDLLVLNTSIIRPASNRYINTYLARLHGAPYEPPHPVLRDVLAETFGVMVYQEDVVNVCVALAGMDVAEADGVRKALTKKRPMKELRAYEAQFRDGAAAYTGRERALRIGLMALKGLSAAGLAAVVSERERAGPYRSFDDLRCRTGLAPADLRVLVQAGACDRVAGGVTRPQLMWLVDAEGRRTAPEQGGRGLGLTSPAALPPLAEYDGDRQLRGVYA